MSEIELSERNVKGRDCLSVKWRNIPIGFIFAESTEQWRISNDLKGEFWALNEFPTQEEAVDALIQKKQNLDEFRLSRLSTQK